MNEFIYMISLKIIQRPNMKKINGKIARSINRNKMGALNKWIQVKDWTQLFIVHIKLWLHNPHPALYIRIISHFLEPLHKSTRICYSTILEREMKANVHHTHPMKTFLVIIINNIYAVVSWCSALPPRGASYLLLLHAMNVRGITMCIECCHCRMKNWNWRWKFDLV